MSYKWIERKPKTNINSGNDLLTKLCNIKGIHKDDVDQFLSPDESVLFPATDMKNSEESAQRIIDAIDNDEKIVVSADNDADGVTATAIIVRYLQERTGNKVPYIYAERDWGHGIAEQIRLKPDEEDNKERNENAEHNIKTIKKSDLLIIVDSSANDVDAVDKIVNKYKTDVIILDHHDINESDRYMDDVGALMVNPQQRGCKYINKDLSGAGVVYKIVGLVEEMIGDEAIDTEKYIDLAGVGISDCANISFLTI